MSTAASASWADGVAERAPTVPPSRMRTVHHAESILDAAHRLVQIKGDKFTTQELVKEAGVALQTFYRHFGGKDRLLLAVMADMVAAACEELEMMAGELADPVARLRCYVRTALGGALGDDGVRAQFMTAEHWRLYQRFPEEMARANQPFADLVERGIRDAAAAGALAPRDPGADAWFVMQLVMAVFHHYAFAPRDEPRGDIAERTWEFCLAALRGARVAQ